VRAVTFNQFGGPEVLELTELPDPEPGPGQIRVAVHAAGVNPIDWKVRSGAMGGPLPRKVGQELAGVVDALGEGVEDVAVGDRVFGLAAGGGAAAELALASDYALIPPSLDFTAAAALPVAVETAVRTLDLLGVSAGTVLVINGAAGTVGSAATQLASFRNARVIGTASERNHEYLRAIGAEPTTYGPGLADRVRALAPDGVDRALDTAIHGALPDLVALTGSPEHVVAIGDFAGAEQNGVRFSGGMGAERAVHALKEIGTLIEGGRFSLRVAQTFPLDQVAEAQRLSESGHPPGKLILLVN
jgi:NADPH:quinone reductase-like Zn-dependent oxidoreductase